MKREELRKIIRGRCVTDEACDSLIDDILNFMEKEISERMKKRIKSLESK